MFLLQFFELLQGWMLIFLETPMRNRIEKTIKNI